MGLRADLRKYRNYLQRMRDSLRTDASSTEIPGAKHILRDKADSFDTALTEFNQQFGRFIPERSNHGNTGNH